MSVDDKIKQYIGDCMKNKNTKLSNLVLAFIEETGYRPSDLVLVEQQVQSEDRLTQTTIYYYAPKTEFQSKVTIRDGQGAR